MGLVNDSSDVSSLFLEGDKLHKVKKRFEDIKDGKETKLSKHDE